MKLLAVLLVSFLLLAASSVQVPFDFIENYWLRVGVSGAEKIHMKLPVRLDSSHNGGRIEFGNSTSSIEGDSGSVWVRLRDGVDSSVTRIGLIADHDGFSGVGVFDAINNWRLWASERPDGPLAGDTIPGIAHFFMLESNKPNSPPELWVAYEDDAGVERRGRVAKLTGTQ